MVVLGAVVDQQEEPGRGEALNEAVQESLSLAVYPVYILEHQEQRLHLALTEEHPLEGIERALAALGWIKREERAVLRQGVQERQQRRDRVLEGRIERQDLAGHFGPDGACIVVLLHMAVALEHVDHGEVRRRLAIRHRSTFERQPPRRVVGMDKLIDQARLPHASLPEQRHHLTMPCSRTLQGLAESGHLRVAAHNAR